ncbi:MAG: 6,7-dimethyl-8-ribityllumazine synthase [Cohaesibacter sp.]|nr:6,7-dimethyl-8-ribityllumazine synthase [Cohaesibacter sp.]
MNQTIAENSTCSSFDASKVRIAFIRASWHRDIVGNGYHGFVEKAGELGIASDAIDAFDVPGGYEIPLQAKLLAKSGDYDAIVACALIVDGGIYRHDFVAKAVIDGMMQVQLETEVPIFSVALTPHHFHEHEEHLGYFSRHFITKGHEAAQACVTTLANVQAAKARIG